MAAGREADTRARDRLGRPVSDDDPERADPGVVVDEERSARATVVTAERLLAEGFPFAAHEVFEAQWKRCPQDERDLWQGLAQWCVAVTHSERGNDVGADRLRQRARGHFSHPDVAAAAQRHGLQLNSIIDWLERPVARLPTLLAEGP